MRPAAVLLVQDEPGKAGDGMYAVDGKDRRKITIPVIETYATKSNNMSLIPDGTYVKIFADYNAWKHIKDGLFYPICNFLISLWEIIIIAIGIIRIHQFLMEDQHFSVLSIGPLCLGLEIIATSIRFAHTILDPFWSARIFHTDTQNVLMTVHIPFSLCSGILLTFYCTCSVGNSVHPARRALFRSGAKGGSGGALDFLTSDDSDSGPTNETNATRDLVPATIMRAQGGGRKVGLATAAVASMARSVAAIPQLRRTKFNRENSREGERARG